MSESSQTSQASGSSATRSQEYRPMAIGTPLGEDVLLIRSIDGIEELGRLFEYRLELVSEESNLNFQDIVGQNVTIRVQRSANEEPRYFNGYVSSFTHVRCAGDQTEYAATIVPWLWFLTRSSDCRIYQNKTVPEIIQEVFREAGFTDFESRLQGDYGQWEYCVQYRETHFNFVSRLMEQEGIYYYFLHENGRHVLVLADGASAHEVVENYEEIQYRPPTDSLREREYISDWSFRHRVQPGIYTHTDFDFKVPNKNLVSSSNVTRQHAAANMEVFDFPGDFLETADGESHARHRIEELHAGYEVCSGQTDARGVTAAWKFSLTEHPRGDQNREYLVTSTSITITGGRFESGGSDAPNYACSFTAIPADQPYRSPRTTPKPVIEGAQTAIVVGPSGEEVHTDEYGRVKVQFHWDRYSAADENSSCWVRVTQAWAGKRWGGIYIPRIGHEVIVDFLEGDPDKPIITGRVYNGGAMPPYDLPGNKTMSTMKTNSSIGGGGFNEIRFEDKKGSEQVFIHCEKDQDVRIKNDRREFIGNDAHLKIKKIQRELVEEDKHLHVKGDHNEKIGGTTSHESGINFQQKVGQNYALEATNEIHLKAGMKMILEAGMQISLKVGGNFIDISQAGIMINGMPTLGLNSGGAAGTGSGSSPKAPEDPDEATNADPGEVAEVTARQHAREAVQLGVSEVREPETSWISIELRNDRGEPMAGEPYRVRTPDGTIRSGALDEEGRARIVGIARGQCEINFPRIDGAEWRRAGA